MTSATESSIDFPKAQLCPKVWDEVLDASGAKTTWQLTDEANSKILKIADYLMRLLNMKFFTVHVVGSIASNQYSSSSDIDVHFIQLDEQLRPVALDETAAREYTDFIRKAFEDQYKAKHFADTMVESHPIEVYFQGNIYQDYMSVGCYDVFQRKWLIGPSFEDPSFNPYSEYYKSMKQTALNDVNQIRVQILAVYEAAVLYIKSRTPDFAFNLKNELHKAAELYDKVHAARSAVTQPTSIEDALQKRASREWKTADMEFKLLDKFGYVGMLKEFKELEGLAASDDVLQEISQQIIVCIKQKIGDKSKLTEQQLDEDAKDMVTMAMLIGMLAIKGVLPAATLETQLKKLDKSEMRASSPKFKDAIAKSVVGKTYNGMNAANIVNAVARTIYAEAKGEGEKGQAAIASVIWNRAGGKCENLIPVISKQKQFSCWNSYSGGWNDKTYTMKIPLEATKPGKSKDIWDNCVKLATQLAIEEFTSTIGDRNSYMNKATADRHNVNTWGNKLDLKIGRHDFGYLSYNDGFKGKQHKTYVVKQGDTLGKIAKLNNVSVDQLAAKNNISDPNKIKVGQEIKI